MASLVCFYLRLTVHHKSDEKVTEDLKKLPLKNDIPYELPKGLRIKVKYLKTEFKGMVVYILNPKDSEFCYIHLHGGGYVRQPRRHHWKYFNRLAKKTENLIIPIYPKAPNHHPKEVYELLKEFYIQLRTKYKKLILSGDSSGGGLALGLCEYLKNLGINLPNRLVLMSPWCDLKLDNPLLDQYQKVDPLISYKSEKIWAQCWAKNLDLKNYMVSPMYGDLTNLPIIDLFVGSREILYPDTIKLNDLLTQSSNKVNLTVGRGMNHVYQIYPIPESIGALKQIERIISEVKNV